jgi:hypothetical protein
MFRKPKRKAKEGLRRKESEDDNDTATETTSALVLEARYPEEVECHPRGGEETWDGEDYKRHGAQMWELLYKVGDSGRTRQRTDDATNAAKVPSKAAHPNVFRIRFGHVH